MNRIKFFLASLILWIPLLMASGVLLGSQASGFDLFKDPCDDAKNQSSVCQAKNQQGKVDPVSGPGGVISTAANILAIVGGIAAVIVIIISGFMYVTAGGAIAGQRAGDSPNRAKKAQSALIGAVIGLIVIVLAWAITRFVVDRVIK